MSEVTPALPGAPRGEHPATEVLRAYREGRLGADEQEALQEHLVSCDWCAELLLGLAPRAEEGAAVASHETAADWRKLRQRLAGEGALPAERRAARLPVWVGWAAAAFWLISVGTAWYAWNLRKELSRPVLYEALVFANPVGTNRAGPDVTRIARGRSTFMSLSIPRDLPIGEYRVELVASSGRVLDAWQWNHDVTVGQLTLGVEARTLPEGELLVRIVGPGSHVRAEYVLKVVSP